MNIRAWLRDKTEFAKRYPDIPLGTESGFAYFNVPDLTGTLPAELAALVSHVTLLEYVHLSEHNRELGDYYLGSAIGRLRPDLPRHCSGPTLNLELQIKAESMEDLNKLYTAIIGGTLPPIVSMSAPQSGPSREELETELREKNAQIRWLRGRIGAMLQEDYVKLAEKLEAPCWLTRKRDRAIIARLRHLASALAVSDETLHNHNGIETE